MPKPPGKCCCCCCCCMRGGAGSPADIPTPFGADEAWAKRGGAPIEPDEAAAAAAGVDELAGGPDRLIRPGRECGPPATERGGAAPEALDIIIDIKGSMLFGLADGFITKSRACIEGCRRDD